MNFSLSWTIYYVNLVMLVAYKTKMVESLKHTKHQHVQMDYNLGRPCFFGKCFHIICSVFLRDLIIETGGYIRNVEPQTGLPILRIKNTADLCFK